MMMNDLQLNALKNSLQNGVVTVTFTKKDGSERVMKCTLAENFISQKDLPKGNNRSVNTETIAVYDVDVSGWRSFRLDSIKSVTV
jgi:hypothetical protein